jgi:hypothetical protein
LATALSTPPRQLDINRKLRNLAVEVLQWTFKND